MLHYELKHTNNGGLNHKGTFSNIDAILHDHDVKKQNTIPSNINGSLSNHMNELTF